MPRSQLTQLRRFGKGRARFTTRGPLGGFVELLEAVADYPDRVWAIEGANGMGRSIAQRLVAFDETVIDVPAKLATRVRVYSTGHGTKSDAAARWRLPARRSTHLISVGCCPTMQRSR
jgi:hypothetical protein